MQKIAFIDIDGTLLNSQGILSSFTIETLKKINHNIQIVLTSARSFPRIKPILEKLQSNYSNNYTICFNGGIIIKNNGEKIEENAIDNKNIKLLIDFIKQYDISKIYFYNEHARYALSEIDENVFFTNNNIYKIVYISNMQEINNIKICLPQKIRFNFQISSSNETRLEFTKKGITKLTAVKKILQLLNLSKNEMIAIGDGENDIEMIKFAKLGVAMGNANEKVKAVADFVTASNDEDGVAKFLDLLNI